MKCVKTQQPTTLTIEVTRWDLIEELAATVRGTTTPNLTVKLPAEESADQIIPERFFETQLNSPEQREAFATGLEAGASLARAAAARISFN